jgi:hypothetical protein
VTRPPVIAPLFAALALIVSGHHGGSAVAGTLFSLATPGPATNRISIAFLSEGYTSAQQGVFLADATNAMSAILGEQPYAEYASLFHFYAIFTNSTQSGSDHPQSGQFRNTYFNSTYDATLDYVITIPTGVTGQGRVDALLNLLLPGTNHPHRLAVLLVNDAKDGGSASTNLAITSTSLLSYSAGNGGILTHELGHLFANLGDEYSASEGVPADASSFPNEPNVTQQTNRALIPWNAWIAPETPVPTDPNDFTWFESVGLFEGARYSPTNWYRPRVNCRMRSTSSGVPFCEVCREATVRAVYQRLRAFDTATPAATALTRTNHLPATFSVAPLRPATHDLTVEWRTNGVPIPGATATNLTLPPGALPPGVHTVRAIVRDETDWVRTGTGVLADTNQWTVTMLAAQLWLEAPQALPGGNFRFTVRGTNVAAVAVQTSSNLTAWTGVATNAAFTGLWHFTNAVGGPLRFHRAVTPPP